MKLGDWIMADHRLVRKTEFIDGKRHKIWIKKQTEANKVLIVGIRTLQNGVTYWDEYGYTFNAKETISALLVCSDLRRKPFYIIRECN